MNRSSGSNALYCFGSTILSVPVCVLSCVFAFKFFIAGLAGQLSLIVISLGLLIVAAGSIFGFLISFKYGRRFAVEAYPELWSANEALDRFIQRCTSSTAKVGLLVGLGLFAIGLIWTYFVQ